MNAESLDIKLLANGKAEVTLVTSDRSSLNHLSILASTCNSFDVSIKKHVEKRSLTANAYLWTLCDKVAIVLRTTKEEVYREAIKRVGVFDHMAIADKAVEAFLSRWNGQGEGFTAEVTEMAKSDGYKVIRAYYGSSVYNSKEMGRLIDYIVDEAKELGIETLTPEKISELMTHFKRSLSEV